MFLKSLLTSLFQREELIRLVFLFGLILSSSIFATTSHNLYDAKGNLMASCGEEGCEYFIYQNVSRTGIVKDNQFNHQANGLDGKAGEMIHDQNGIINSQLWIPDFHGSVIAKLDTKRPETILFDAFGGVLNEEDCQDYHYTDKPRVGCTSLHNFNARFYDPKIGRFITTDPIEQHNLNWFMYGNNNPLSFVDPDGQNALCKELALIQKRKSFGLLKNPHYHLLFLPQRTLSGARIDRFSAHHYPAPSILYRGTSATFTPDILSQEGNIFTRQEPPFFKSTRALFDQHAKTGSPYLTPFTLDAYIAAYFATNIFVDGREQWKGGNVGDVVGRVWVIDTTLVNAPLSYNLFNSFGINSVGAIGDFSILSEASESEWILSARGFRNNPGRMDNAVLGYYDMVSLGDNKYESIGHVNANSYAPLVNSIVSSVHP